jgi:UDP-N-acetylmuramyl pentapeptide synthase
VQGTFLFGKEMESAFNYLKREAYANTLYFTDDYDELEHQVTSHVRGGDLVLLKGSRAMAMERLVEPLSLVS